MRLWLFAILIAALGLADDYYLALIVIIALTVLGIATLFRLCEELDAVPGGTSGGIAIMFMMLPVLLVLVALWLGEAFGKIDFSSVDLSAVGH